jgi:hypothetical protein
VSVCLCQSLCSLSVCDATLWDRTADAHGVDTEFGCMGRGTGSVVSQRASEGTLPFRRDYRLHYRSYYYTSVDCSSTVVCSL